MPGPHQLDIFDLREISNIIFLLQSKVIKKILKTLVNNIFKFIICNYLVHFENSNWHNMSLNFLNFPRIKNLKPVLTNQ